LKESIILNVGVNSTELCLQLLSITKSLFLRQIIVFGEIFEINRLYLGNFCFKKFPPFLGDQIPVAVESITCRKGFFPQFSDSGGFFTGNKIDMVASE
jgi:hypothetical protein